MKKRFFSALLALCMVFALLPAGAMAADSTSSIASLTENISSPSESQNVRGMGGIRVAEIDGRGYSSLQNAVNEVQEGQTIKLMVAGYTLSAAVSIAEDNETSFTFDLNGYTLGSTQGVISHKGSGTLTVIDSMHSQSARLTTSAKSSDTIEVLNEGSLILESGTIEHAGEETSFVGAIHGCGYGGIYIKGGTVRTASGYAIITELLTTVNITGGLVAAQNGTAIYVTDMGDVIVGGTAKITSANTDTDSGTIVMAHFNSWQTDVYLEITGGTVENTAANGNALTNLGYGTAELSGGVVDGSGVNGAGVLVKSRRSQTIVIKKGALVVKGRGIAINGTPLLEEDVQLLAGLGYDSDALADYSLSLLFPDDLHRFIPFFNYKYLRFGPTTAVAKIGTRFYADLQEAFYDGASGSTILLVADNALKQTVFNEKGKNFTLDLNGKTLSCPSGSVLFNAWGELTVTDNSAAKNGVIDGDIKNGLNTLTIAGGTVHESGRNAVAISSSGRSGPIVISGGTVSASGVGAYAIQNDSQYPVRVSGDAVISSELWWAISGKKGVVIEGGWPVIRGGGRALNTSTAPSFDSAKVTVNASKFYEGTPTTPYDASQIYSYKYLGFAPAPIENHDDQSFPTPEENHDDQGFPAPEESHATQNDRDNSSITVWLSGGDFNRNDLLNTQVLTSGSDYTAMMKLKDENDVLGSANVIAVFGLSLKSSIKTTGDAIYVNFDLSAGYAEQAFTLVYKKPDGTYDYIYAMSDGKGNATFGPIYELSPVMLVEGTLPNEPMDVDEMNTQAGGVFEMYLWGINVWWFISIGAALVFGAAVMVVIIVRKKRNN